MAPRLWTTWSQIFTVLCVLGGLFTLAAGQRATAAVLLFGSAAHSIAVHVQRRRLVD